MLRIFLLSLLVCLVLSPSGMAAETASIGVSALVEYPVGYNVGGQTDDLSTFDIICPGQRESNWIIYEELYQIPDPEQVNIETKSDSRIVIITVVNLAD